ncbi:hypothetical protein ACTFIZ_000414 [Dictyostelium cf. discoideum]
MVIEHIDDENKILGHFYNVERERRRRHIEILFKERCVLFRKNSVLINEYINNFDPQKKKLKDMEILFREKKIIYTIYQDLYNKYKSEGLLLIGKYKNRFANFIVNGGCLKEFIENEIEIQKNRKIALLDKKFKKFHIDKHNLKFYDKYLEHINTFKPSQKKIKKVWSMKKIIQNEKNNYYNHKY